MDSLCILLPVRLQGRDSLQACLRRLAALGAGLHPASAGQPPMQISVLLGVDEDDGQLSSATSALKDCFAPAVNTAACVLNASSLAVQRERCAGAAPLCWMWSELALAACQRYRLDWLVLLGDDVEVQPAGWPHLVADFVRDRRHLRCVALLDVADPGFPSFPIVSARHLKTFGRMLPEELKNQGGDPLLYELYRSFGLAAICPSVTVANMHGGPGGCIFPALGGGTDEPRYARRPLATQQWTALLEDWRHVVAAREGLEQRRRAQVAVAVPSYRGDVAALTTILERSTAGAIPGADVRVLVCVDNPACSSATLGWLREQQHSRMDGMRGAAAARNTLLEEGDACDLIIFFDDDVEPTPGCVAAYVAAMRAHPAAAAFAGPTWLERRPLELLPCAIHMSDATFFWEAPASLQLGPCVPWAVTANMAVRPTTARFRPGFPKTGGGEDVDFCLQLGAALVAVPDAEAHHPWWPARRPKVYMRFWGWAAGDGRLIQLWPRLSYRRAANPLELCLTLAAVTPALTALGAASAGGVAAGLLAILAADLALTVLRNCCLADRRAQHPCAWWLRPLAAAEAWLVAMFSEAGRTVGHLRRGSWGSLARSFDWFCGGHPAVVAQEQRRAAARMACCCLAALAAWALLEGNPRG